MYGKFILKKIKKGVDTRKIGQRGSNLPGSLVPRILGSILSPRGRIARPSLRRKLPDEGNPRQMQLSPSEALRKQSIARKGQVGLTGKCGYSIFYSFLFIFAVICEQDDQDAFFPLRFSQVFLIPLGCYPNGSVVAVVCIFSSFLFYVGVPGNGNPEGRFRNENRALISFYIYFCKLHALSSSPPRLTDQDY